MSTRDRIQVWCTDGRQHGRAELGAIRDEDGVLQPVTTRQAPAPWPSDGKVRANFEGEVVESVAPTRIISMAPVVREDFEGAERWRFRCRRCGRDVPISGQRMRILFDGILATPERGFDVSLIPRQ